ncbi:conserved hypothetical protein [Thermosulfidibacter takaii ABI70S6]|uniref:DUF4234 domain-containing protein n=1 Tax=Thermosulfidibacter takaii (strain DSM 17441 / JCM 13301 / NBRC 103674 / ABI70S6) TaxID=1298851 RepID=A0A0S3QRE3_THET7|nr:DUF4234 domain-containing protein [Thermosulfidibacter takaii]BAT70857.1 conserved hypothetical protein [Thermosulfidibacter takaii ABI70S6]
MQEMEKRLIGFRVAEMDEDSVVKNVVLSLITCGLWNVYWQYKQMRTMNHLLGERYFSFPKWLLFTLITCGLYHFYHEYVMGKKIADIQYEIGMNPSHSLPVLSVVLAVLSAGLITDAIQQHEINEIVSYLKKSSYVHEERVD